MTKILAILILNGLLAAPPAKGIPTEKQLMEAIEAIRAPHIKLTVRYKRSLAKAALRAYRKTGVDPILMIAIARMESDFRRLIRPGLPCNPKYPKSFCWADCGVTQHHVRGYTSYVLRYCQYLKWNHKESFLQSSREIAYLKKWCKAKRPYYGLKKPWTLWDRNYTRCILNQYNQGTYYKRAPRCWSRKGKRFSQCMDLSAYWKKVQCFKYGAERLIRSKYDICRSYKGYWKATPTEIRRRAYPNTPTKRRLPKAP